MGALTITKKSSIPAKNTPSAHFHVMRKEMEKPKIVVMCGSSKFVEIMAVAEWLIERNELAITMGLSLLPQWYPDCPSDHLAEHEGCAEAMDELHLRKIDLADEIFVVDWDGYIGESTSKEIKYAEKEGKYIRYFSSDFVGRQVCKLITTHSSGSEKDCSA